MRPVTFLSVIYNPCRRKIDGVTGRQPTVVMAVAVPQDDGVGKRESGWACSKHHWGATMEHYAGIDVSLESASLCVVDATGRIVREAKVVSEPEILIGWFHGLELAMTRIGLEAGPLSQWLPVPRRAKMARPVRTRSLSRTLHENSWLRELWGRFSLIDARHNKIRPEFDRNRAASDILVPVAGHNSRPPNAL